MIKLPHLQDVMPAALLAAAALLPTSASLAADPFKTGSEFQISSYTTGRQENPRVAMNASGDFVVVWNSMDQDGSGSGILARQYDSSGSPLGGEFLVNTFTPFDQLYPVAAVDPFGEFVIAWDSDLEDGGDAGIFVRDFDSSGAPLSGNIQVNTYYTSSQTFAAISGDDSGNFFVVWNSLNQVDPNSAYDIFGQAFDSDCLCVGSEFPVNVETTENQMDPAISTNGSGDFVVVWGSFYQDGDASGIFGRRFDSSGSPVGGEFLVSEWTTGSQRFPRVAMHDSGSFVVVWDDSSRDGSYYGIFGRRFNSSGQPLAGSFLVNTTTTDYQRLPAISMDASGNFVVVWEDYGSDGDGYGAVGQFFLSTGTKVGSEFVVNTYTTDWQRLPDVAMDDDGNFVVTWESRGQDGDMYGVFGQAFSTIAPFSVTAPLDGGSVDCSDPATSVPTITWDPGRFERFRVWAGSDPGFVKGTRIKSWKGFKPVTSWTPSKKKWKIACKKALAGDPSNPVLHIRVEGRDDQLPKTDPAKLDFTPTIVVDALF